MAILFPSALPEALERHPLYRGELKVFRHFGQLLDDEWTVIYSCLFDAPMRAYERPLDLVVLHRIYGLLVIEIKAGDIRFTSDLIEQSAKNRYRWHVITPHQQVKKAARQLLAQLRAANIISGYIPDFCALCFPDKYRSDTDVAAFSSRQYSLFNSDLTRARLPEIIKALMPLRPGQQSAWRSAADYEAVRACLISSIARGIAYKENRADRPTRCKMHEPAKRAVAPDVQKTPAKKHFPFFRRKRRLSASGSGKAGNDG